MGSLVACHRKKLIRLVKRILEIELDDEASRRLQFACFSGKRRLLSAWLSSQLKWVLLSQTEIVGSLSLRISSFYGFRVYGLCVLLCLIEFFFIIIIFVSQKNIELSHTISTIGSKI